MAIHELNTFLKNHPDKWYTKKQLQSEIGIKMPNIDRAIKMLSFYIEKRIAPNQPVKGNQTFQICEYRYKPITIPRKSFR